MSEEHKKLFLQWMVPTLGLVVLVIIMFFNFFIRTRMNEVAAFEAEIIRITGEYAKEIYDDVNIMERMGEVLADVIANSSELSRAWIETAETVLVTDTPADEVMYYDGKEFCFTHDGRRLRLSEYSYAAAVIRAVSTKYIYLKEDGNGGREVILVVIPIGNNTGKRLMMFYPLEKLGTFLNMNTEFDSQTFTALMNLDGSILLRGEKGSKFLANGNMWYNLDQEKYQTDITRVRVQITNGNSGLMTAAVEDEKRTLVYVPVGFNEWFLMAGINQSYVEETENQYWYRTSLMLYELLAVVAVFLIGFFVINLVARKRAKEKDKLLQEKADTDLLTGLTNKLATERKIKEYISKYPDSLAMLFVLDIDNFKKINDTMGHAFGDEVLRSLGSQIGAVFRLTDIIGRTGGDEFMIFLKFLKTDEDTLKEAQKLVSFFKDFVAGEYVKYSATASIGAAVFPAHGKDFESLYKAADKALYKAKKRGKNQLAFYDDRDRPGQEEEYIPDDVLLNSRGNDR